MKIALGSDHAGYDLKNRIKDFVETLGYEPYDLGPYSQESVDYPDFAVKVAHAVRDKQCDLGILVCGTGLGMAIAANKIKGIRAVTCSDTFSARCSREHNDANILCIGARVVGEGLAMDIVKTWLESEFEGGRHLRRVNKIIKLEEVM
ncbi:MAG TPA: ribose 5-phosphate isomerase B [Bacillota bacterium]|jgi:ribose 5-phosphate isomerase B|nr:ribose 5-phosphate isomerase B [Bacillota bacterium]HOL11583.1 ribose 5-phosphate isomerase B [Bacillota bacterium]HOQ02711.1 ribose 5-phosphate isomerase B [Bacillota bacterium]HPV13112.1 ribose 5-phosphate isomerase B [Bacillota bacterium]